MRNKHINSLFEVMTPTAEQKDRVLHNIAAQTPDAKPWANRAAVKLAPIAACLVLAFTLTTAVNAATGGAIFNGVTHILFAGGSEITILENGGFQGSETEQNWLVKKTWGKLVLEVNGEKIDITKDLKANGYYYYTYQDDTDTLQRVYIVKNNGESYAERWYSQFEYLPELGYGTGKAPGNMATAISLAETEAEENGADLDTVLKQRLNAYWKEPVQ
jgi:hypothetical protein